MIGYRIVSVSFAFGVEKGLRRDKWRLLKMPCLSRGKIGKTGKYRGNGKTRKTKNRVALVPSNLTSSKKKKNEWTLPNKRETSPIPFRGDNYISPARR